MSYTIRFPHLHIVLNHVGQSIDVFGFRIAYYGIVIAIGMILGVMMVLHEAKRTGQSEDSYLDIAIWTIIFAVIGARIYYVVFAWDLYKDNLLSIFNIRQGGLAIYGGVLAGILTAFIITRIKKMNFLLVADTCIIGLPIGQMLGRWGNFFNREAFGEYTNSLFAMQIPVNAVRQEDAITAKMMAHVKTIDDVAYISVHPTFLYESLWSLGVFLILLFMRKHVKFHGQQFLTYLVVYGAGRFWIEGLRTDQLFLTGTSIPVSQLLAAIMVVGGIILLIVGGRYAKKHPLTENEAAAIAGKPAVLSTEGSADSTSEETSTSSAPLTPDEPEDDGGVLTVDEVIRRTDERLKQEKEAEEKVKAETDTEMQSGKETEVQPRQETDSEAETAKELEAKSEAEDQTKSNN